MQGTLRVLGILCLIAAGGCVVLALVDPPGVLRLAPGLALVGILFLALAAILDRLAYVEMLLKSSATDRIKTDIGEFERLHNVEGDATCVGCRRTAPRTDLYYNASMDVYYHPECLVRDRSR